MRFDWLYTPDRLGSSISALHLYVKPDLVSVRLSRLPGRHRPGLASVGTFLSTASPTPVSSGYQVFNTIVFSFCNMVAVDGGNA